jgi:hypothetical protein
MSLHVELVVKGKVRSNRVPVISRDYQRDWDVLGYRWILKNADQQVGRR